MQFTSCSVGSNLRIEIDEFLTSIACIILGRKHKGPFNNRTRKIKRQNNKSVHKPEKKEFFYSHSHIHTRQKNQSSLSSWVL